MNERFARVNENFAHVGEQFARADDGFTGIRAKLDEAATGQQHIADLLQRLIDEP